MKNTFNTLFTIQSKNKKLLYVSFTILGILFTGCAKRDDVIFDNGLKFFNEGNYINAHKEFSKIQMESQYYDSTKMYLTVCLNEQNLHRIEKKYVKDGSYLSFLPKINAKTEKFLSRDTEIELYYTFGNWSRIYRAKEDNWLSPDVPELNGWIKSSLLENEIQHKNRIREEKKREEKNKKLSEQWYQGGTLHKATYAVWKNASYKNKLATSSDWLISTSWKGHLNSPDDLDRLKIKAKMLVSAVDEIVSTNYISSLIVTEIAASIITLSNDLGPY